MYFKRVNRKTLLALVQFILFVLGSIVGVCGSLFGLIGTQAMTGRESAFEIFLIIGSYHSVSWVLGGLIVATGFCRTKFFATVLIGFIGGGILTAFILTILMGTVGFGFRVAIFIEILIPLIIGGAVVLRTLIVARKLNNLKANDSTQK
jgi:hypothetical protein